MFELILSLLLLLLLSLFTAFFFLILNLYQKWSPPLWLQVPDCSTFRFTCDIPSTAVVFCSFLRYLYLLDAVCHADIFVYVPIDDWGAVLLCRPRLAVDVGQLLGRFYLSCWVGLASNLWCSLSFQFNISSSCARDYDNYGYLPTLWSSRHRLWQRQLIIRWTLCRSL